MIGYTPRHISLLKSIIEDYVEGNIGRRKGIYRKY